MTPEQITQMQDDMAQGTPGPWLVMKDAEAGVNQGYFVSGGGFARADMTGPGHACGPNARRIARVPDLEAEVIRRVHREAELEAEVIRLREALGALADGVLNADNMTDKTLDRAYLRARAALNGTAP
jgi:hypothetical protein